MAGGHPVPAFARDAHPGRDLPKGPGGVAADQGSIVIEGGEKRFNDLRRPVIRRRAPIRRGDSHLAEEPFSLRPLGGAAAEAGGEPQADLQSVERAGGCRRSGGRTHPG